MAKVETKVVPDPSTFPCLSSPFSIISFGEGDYCGWTIIDVEGRVILYEQHNKEFVKELCAVMNENNGRLVEAWKKGAS